MSNVERFAPLNDRRFWMVQGLVALLVGGHLLSEFLLVEVLGTPALYFVPEGLFLIPVGYAALTFGLRGSLPTAILCTALTLPNLVLFHGSDEALGVLFQLAVVNFVGYVVGDRIDQRNRVQQERDETHAALLESESRYRALFQASADPLLVLDSDCRIKEANRAAGVTFLYPAGELSGATLADLVGPDGAQRIAGQWAAAASTGHGRGEYPVRLRDGRAVWLEGTCAAVETVRGGEPLVYLSLRDVTQQRIRHEELRTFTGHVLRAQEEERRRIAQELHDETLQGLILLCRRLDAVEESSGLLPERTIAAIHAARDSTEELVDLLRNFTRDLRPPALDDLGVVPTVERLLSDLGQRSGIDWDLKVSGTPRRLPPEPELGIFRIVQESVRNVERHAGARSVKVRFSFESERLELTIRDDGRGFDPRKVGGPCPTSLGLIGIQERAALLGGLLSIRSAAGGGTTVSLVMQI